MFEWPQVIFVILIVAAPLLMVLGRTNPKLTRRIFGRGSTAPYRTHDGEGDGGDDGDE